MQISESSVTKPVCRGLYLNWTIICHLILSEYRCRHVTLVRVFLDEISVRDDFIPVNECMLMSVHNCTHS